MGFGFRGLGRSHGLGFGNGGGVRVYGDQVLGFRV